MLLESSKYYPRQDALDGRFSSELTTFSLPLSRAHLYTYHYIHQCQRCTAVFPSEPDLDAHVKALEPCPSRNGVPVDGISSKTKALLQCRKKTHRDQTEEDRWIQIYSILFELAVDEIIPSPCTFYIQLLPFVYIADEQY